MLRDLRNPDKSMQGFLAWWAQARRRQRGGGLTIDSLEDLPDLLALYVAQPATLSFSSGPDIDAWGAWAGSSAPTLTYLGDGETLPPQFSPDAFGLGRPGIYFRNYGLRAAELLWTPTDATAVMVVALDPPNIAGPNPRFGAWEHLGVGGWDWNSWDCWILGCYAAEVGFVADRGVQRPVAMTFDTAATYLIAVRKCGATITAWLRPVGGEAATASGSTAAAGFVVTEFWIGGNSLGDMLAGTVGHFALWPRGLSDDEVTAALSYLTKIYG